MKAFDKKILKDLNSDCNTFLKEEATKTEAYIKENLQPKLQYFEPNIQDKFGDFINQVFAKMQYRKYLKMLPLENHPDYKRYAQYAKDNKQTMEEYLKTGNGPDFCFASVGKGFEFANYETSYKHTGGTKRKTVKINYHKLFGYITKEHSELIINKDKTDCLRDMVQFRDRYFELVSALNVVHKIEAVAKIAVVQSVSFSKPANIHNYGDNDNTLYHMLTDIKEIPVTSLYFNIHNESFDDIKQTRSCHIRKYEVKQSSKYTPVKINMRFDTGNGYVIKSDSVNYIGGLLFDRGECKFTINEENPYSANLQANSGYGTKVQGYLLNYYELFENPKVKELLTNVCDTLNKAGKTWQYLVNKHAGLKFLYGSSI